MNSVTLVVLLNSGSFDNDLPTASEILNLLICHDLLPLKLCWSAEKLLNVEQ